MSATKTQTQAGFAVLRKQFEMQREAMNMLLPVASRAPAASGTGQLVDKTA